VPCFIQIRPLSEDISRRAE